MNIIDKCRCRACGEENEFWWQYPDGKVKCWCTTCQQANNTKCKDKFVVWVTCQRCNNICSINYDLSGKRIDE